MQECIPIYEFLRAKAVTGYGKIGKIPRALPASAATACEEETVLLHATANEGILVWVGGQLLPRHMAKVCIYSFVDGVAFKRSVMSGTK